MRVEEAILRVQHAYPQIFLACHVDHQNARSTPYRLSQRDSSILSHLSSRKPNSQRDLGRHLGIAKSTLSEAIAWLTRCGYVEKVPGGGRESLLRLTVQGVQAMSGTSVLDRKRLGKLLGALTESQLRAAVKGLEVLAEATRKVRGSK